MGGAAAFAATAWAMYEVSNLIVAAGQQIPELKEVFERRNEILANGEEWEYVNGVWRSVSTANNDQEEIDALKARVGVIEDVNDDQSEEIEQNEELLEPVNSALINLASRIEELETLDVQSAVSALAIAQQDIIELKSRVNSLELTSFLILE